MLGPLSAQAGPSRLPFILSRPFSSTPIAQASKRKALAKRRKAANLARRHQLESASNAGTVDPVLGIVVPSRSSSSGRNTSTTSSTASTSAASVASEKYLSSRLARTVLSAPAVWNTPPTTGPSPPERLLPGISAEDRAMIFGAVPAVSAELASMAPGAKLEEVVRDQEAKSGVLARVLDLRNASKRGIEVANRQRIVEAFGADAKGGGCGGSKVQVALLTHKIRSLAEHLSTNPRDTANRRALRTMVHKRAGVLKYFKRTRPLEYDALLTDLGLERRAVEGELIVR